MTDFREDFFPHMLLLEEAALFMIEPAKEQNARDTCTPFEGIPRKHPGNDRLILLYPDPFNDDGFFYEFSVNSISLMDELEMLQTENGKSLRKVRIWITKGSTVLKAHRFTVS